MGEETETATFAAAGLGGVEAEFRMVGGVISTSGGYCGVGGGARGDGAFGEDEDGAVLARQQRRV